jgi:predicted nucleotidyltransferase
MVVDARLAEVARTSDAATRHARNELVRAVREAAAGGMTQAQIAAEIGRSQPEVSRLLRFHGTTPLARRLRASRAEVLGAVAKAGGRDVRVFGSVARGEDDGGSDVDLLFVMGRPLSLMELGRLEDEVSAAVGVPVDLVPESSLRPALRDRALVEAVPL